MVRQISDRSDISLISQKRSVESLFANKPAQPHSYLGFDVGDYFAPCWIWARSFSFSSHEYDMISVFWRVMGSVMDQGSVKNFGSSNVAVHLIMLLSSFWKCSTICN